MGMRVAVDRFEQSVRDLAEVRFSEWRIPGVSLESISLEGAFPATQLVIIFRHRSRPACRFGMKFELWEGISPDSEVDPDIIVTPAIAGVQEEIEAADLGLPEDCSPATVTWL